MALTLPQARSPALRPRLGPERSAELAPHHLAQGVAGQRLDEADLAWALERRQLRRRPARASDARSGSPTTKATTVSPHSAEGIPTTATSATPGWRASTASTSAGYTLWPPVMISSVRRPRMVT